MADSRIVQLATEIINNTTKVDAYLQVKGLPSPSFHEDGPVEFGIQSEDISKARENTIDASLELHNLLLGPSLTIRPYLNGISLQAIYRYDIASKVPIHGEISFADLSSKCGLDLINLRRCLRFAMAYHYVFCEPRPDFVAHTAASRVLVDDPMARSGVGWFFDELFQASARTIEARQKWGTDEPQHSGWSLSQNTNESVWAHYAAHPEMAQRFAGCMSALANMVGRVPSFLVNGYPWTSVGSSGNGTVVDIGGSKGTVSIEIAKSAPHLHFIVQDLPEMIHGAEAGVPPDLKARIEFMSHDMFNEQPVRDADVYLFRNVFHNWSDGHTIRALKALVPALKPGTKVVVNDYFIPEQGTMTPSKEREVRAMDLIMFSLFNARERERKDWEMVFQQADPRFQNLRIWTPEGSALCIIECEWRDLMTFED